MKYKVLFLCAGNSTRSQMAEVILNNIDPEHFEAYSAGTQESEIDHGAAAALTKAGLTAIVPHPYLVNQLQDMQFDYIIFLCKRDSEESQVFSSEQGLITWDFEDPSCSQAHDPYDTTLKELSERIKMFVLLKQLRMRGQEQV